MRLIPAAALAVALVTTACSGSAPADDTTTGRTPPDLEAFLQLPVATPSACPPSANGTTVGRQSPWVGHVDVSVFLDGDGRELRPRLERLPAVADVYYESKQEAYEEFRRLYTCSDRVRPGSLPASYRLVLAPGSRSGRDALIRQLYRLPGVSSVSCDPADPCVDVQPPS